MSKIKENKNNEDNKYKLKQKFIKYPFSGVASNLIDKFLVLGYDQKKLEKPIDYKEMENLNIYNNYLKYFYLKERPTIINEICSNYKKESQESDVILQIIYPNFPRIYFFGDDNNLDNKEKEKFDLNEDLNNKSIIFSINPQDNEGNKKSFNGFGYTFYSKKEHRNKAGEIDGIIHYPTTFVILSDFPFYFQFHKICKNVHEQMMKKTEEMPIDIILYNAIKFCPSPINVNLYLSFGMKLQGNFKNKITRGDILNQLFPMRDEEKINSIPYIFLNQLSGYPLMDFNLSFLFSLLEPRMVILTFILTFLEYDIIFFSAEPEILNIVMYIFNNLNYPFNESIYYWHVVSLSKENFMSNAESPFIGKVSSSMMGICSAFDPNLKTTNKVKEHFVLNIDDKTLSYSCSETTDQGDSDKIMELYDYLNECLPELDYKEDEENIDELTIKEKYNDGLNLFSSIRKLASTLNRRARAVTKTNYNETNYRPSFFVPYEGENEMDMMRENLQIQKAFYTFLIQIFSNYISEFKIESYLIEEVESNTNKLNKKFPIMINIKKKEKGQDDLNEQGKLFGYNAGLTFKKLFRQSSKFSTFLTSFCQYHDCITELKIPFSFFYEYLYFSRVSPDNCLDPVDIFLIIDQFYGKIKKIDFFELMKEKRENEKDDEQQLKESIKKEKNIFKDFKYIYNFSYNEFEQFYKKELRTIINREQEDDKNIFTKDQTSLKQLRIYKRNNFLLSQKILEIYINFSNNHFHECQECFKLIECEDIINEQSNQENIINEKNNKKGHDNIIKEAKKEEEIDYKNIMESNNKISATYELMEISDIIEKHLVNEKYFSPYEIMKFSLLNIIAITMGMKKEINNALVMKIICDFCVVTNSLVRKYMNIFLLIFTHMKLNMELDKKQCDDCIKLVISYFKTTNTFPSEDTNISILISKAYNSKDDVQVSYKSLETFKKCKKPDRERRAEFYTKTNKINEDEVVEYIEKVNTGWYYIKNNKLEPNIKYFAKKYGNLYSGLKINKNGEFIPKTPLELYASTNKLLFEFLSDFHIEKNKYGELGVIVLSLLYYFKMDFFLPKWNFKRKNVRNDKNLRNLTPIDINNSAHNDIVKKLVVDIIFILLDLYEAIVEHIGK